MFKEVMLKRDVVNTLWSVVVVACDSPLRDRRLPALGLDVRSINAQKCRSP